jgi:hypothetical protein
LVSFLTIDEPEILCDASSFRFLSISYFFDVFGKKKNELESEIKGAGIWNTGHPDQLQNLLFPFLIP